MILEIVLGLVALVVAIGIYQKKNMNDDSMKRYGVPGGTYWKEYGVPVPKYPEEKWYDPFGNNPSACSRTLFNQENVNSVARKYARTISI